jgi:hypothetical protein
VLEAKNNPFLLLEGIIFMAGVCHAQSAVDSGQLAVSR